MDSESDKASASTSPEGQTVRLTLTSILGTEFHAELEELFFFNAGQATHRGNIIACVEKYGSPRLVERLGGIRIEIPKAPDAQTLYAVAEVQSSARLVGVMIYTRSSAEEFEILHMAVDSDGPPADCATAGTVTSFLITELCRIARRVKGVQTVRLPYRGGRIHVDRWTT